MPRAVNTTPFSAYLRDDGTATLDRPEVPLGRVLTDLLRSDGAVTEDILLGTNSVQATRQAIETLEGLGLVEGDGHGIRLTEEGKRAAELQRG